MKASIYRCTKYCNNCPFLDNGKSINLRLGRVDNIKKDLLKGNNFVCHKTVYDLDENMNPTEPQEQKMCYGAYIYLKEQNKPNQIMQIAERFGVDET